MLVERPIFDKPAMLEKTIETEKRTILGWLGTDLEAARIKIVQELNSDPLLSIPFEGMFNLGKEMGDEEFNKDWTTRREDVITLLAELKFIHSVSKVIPKHIDQAAQCLAKIKVYVDLARQTAERNLSGGYVTSPSSKPAITPAKKAQPVKAGSKRVAVTA